MSDDRFPRQLHRFWIRCAFAALAFGGFAYRVPAAAGWAALGFVLIVAFALVLHRGLILTADGLTWYVVHPRFVYRRVPWAGVNAVRTGFFGNRLYLDVDPGRYEPVLWGRVRSPITIHVRELVRGEELRDAIESFRGAAA